MINNRRNVLSSMEIFTQLYLHAIKPLTKIEQWFSLDEKNSDVCAEIFHLANRYGCIPCELDKKRADIQTEMLSLAAEIINNIELCHKFINESLSRDYSKYSQLTMGLFKACNYKINDARSDEEKQFEKEQADRLLTLIDLANATKDNLTQLLKI